MDKRVTLNMSVQLSERFSVLVSAHNLSKGAVMNTTPTNISPQIGQRCNSFLSAARNVSVSVSPK